MECSDPGQSSKIKCFAKIVNECKQQGINFEEKLSKRYW